MTLARSFPEKNQTKPKQKPIHGKKIRRNKGKKKTQKPKQQQKPNKQKSCYIPKAILETNMIQKNKT